MSHQNQLSRWMQEVSSRMPHLSKPQATVLALLSFGMVVVQSSGISRLSLFLALLLDEQENTLRQRLREWYYDAPDKRGQQRQQVDVTTCFAPLLRWVLANWSPTDRRLALALDASTLRQVFTVLSVSVMYRGCAIPVAWVVLPACEPGAWQPHWRRLLAALHGVIPAEWLVIVLTDRGLYAPWLYRAIQANHWHPFMRINTQGLVRPHGQVAFRPLRSLVSVGEAWRGTVECFKTAASRLSCTLVARWEAGYTDPWLIVTDLPPETSDALWYGMRSWIEQGFKDCKRGGWHWEQTKMTDPARANRLWLVMAVATLWVVSVGGAADAHLPASRWQVLPTRPIARPTAKHRLSPRRLSCFTRGILTVLARLIRSEPIPMAAFVPEMWSSSPLSMAHRYVPF